MLLMLVQPTGWGHDEKGKWIQSRMAPEIIAQSAAPTLQSFQSD
jgi:hypothetical protein